MLQSIVFWDAGLISSIAVNEFTNPFYYPVHRFVWDQSTRGDDLPKMQAAGRHERYSDIDVLPLVMEGHFKTDDTTQYWVKRKALMNILIPNDNHLYRYHSRVVFKLDGDSESYYGDLTLKDYDAPVEANYPTVTPFQFQWEVAYGYWRKLSDGTIAKI